MTAPVVAPDAPTPWGQPVTPTAMAAYLDQLTRWRDQRRRELDELDQAALAAGDPTVTADVTLAMALWQTVAARTDELTTVWAGGRVGPVELADLSARIWGRTQATGPGQPAAAAGGVSLPEACRLSDAVTAQLRTRLALGAGAGDTATALRSLRASVERIRDLASARSTDRAVTDALATLDRRLADATDRARRGADVGGLLGPLQTEIATLERDLIVAAARARDDERDHTRAIAWRGELADEARAVTVLADACAAKVTPAPVLGIPSLDALGPVPDDPTAVDAYLGRLDTVRRALGRAREVYTAPLTELDQLTGLLQATGAQARALGRAALPEVAALADVGADLLATAPVDLPRLRGLTRAYRVLLEPGDRARPTADPARTMRPVPPTAPGRNS